MEPSNPQSQILPKVPSVQFHVLASELLLKPSFDAGKACKKFCKEMYNAFDGIAETSPQGLRVEFWILDLDNATWGLSADSGHEILEATVPTELLDLTKTKESLGLIRSGEVVVGGINFLGVIPEKNWLREVCRASLGLVLSYRDR